jgi:hypothetical protein
MTISAQTEKKKKKTLKPQEAWHQYDLIGDELPVVK